METVCADEQACSKHQAMERILKSTLENIQDKQEHKKKRTTTMNKTHTWPQRKNNKDERGCNALLDSAEQHVSPKTQDEEDRCWRLRP